MSNPSPRTDSEQLRKRARPPPPSACLRDTDSRAPPCRPSPTRLGISKQALLYHFDSKDGLREAALSEILEVWRSSLPRLLSTLTREGARFEDSLTEIMSFFRAEPAYARFMMQELLQPTRTNSIVRDVEPWLTVAADFIRRAQKDGTVDEDVDPEAWVVNFGTLILATLSFLDESREQPSAERVIREMARVAGTSLVRNKKVQFTLSLAPCFSLS